jgi:hypothetical protein
MCGLYGVDIRLQEINIKTIDTLKVGVKHPSPLDKSHPMRVIRNKEVNTTKRMLQ